VTCTWLRCFPVCRLVDQMLRRKQGTIDTLLVDEAAAAAAGFAGGGAGGPPPIGAKDVMKTLLSGAVVEDASLPAAAPQAAELCSGPGSGRHAAQAQGRVPAATTEDPGISGRRGCPGAGWLPELAPGPLPGLQLPKPPAYITTVQQADAACAQLAARVASKEVTVLGFDCEWKPHTARGKHKIKGTDADKCDVVQLGTVSGETYVFHIARMHHEFPRGKFHYEFPRGLKCLLENADVKKVGNRVHNDVNHVAGFHVAVQNAVELGHMAHDRGVWHTRAPALDTLVRLLCQAELSKEQEVRCGDWFKPLETEQVEYAALDAYASVMVYERLLQVASPLEQATRQATHAFSDPLPIEVPAPRAKPPASAAAGARPTPAFSFGAASRARGLALLAEDSSDDDDDAAPGSSCAPAGAQSFVARVEQRGEQLREGEWEGGEKKDEGEAAGEAGAASDLELSSDDDPGLSERSHEEERSPAPRGGPNPGPPSEGQRSPPSPRVGAAGAAARVAEERLLRQAEEAAREAEFQGFGSQGDGSELPPPGSDEEDDTGKEAAVDEDGDGGDDDDDGVSAFITAARAHVAAASAPAPGGVWPADGDGAEQLGRLSLAGPPAGAEPGTGGRAGLNVLCGVILCA
jgi:hypothetical protein